MNALLNQVWDESSAVDRVWAQFTGLAPHCAVRRPLMVLQAFVDESYRKDGLFVLGGLIARAEVWADFARDWNEMLPLAARGPKGNFRFKMSEMASNPQRMQRAQAFYNIIENHAVLPISVLIDSAHLVGAAGRLWAINYFKHDENNVPRSYYLAFDILIRNLYERREQLDPFIDGNDRIDFIFDDLDEKTPLLESSDIFINGLSPEARDRVGRVPRFESDDEFLPLQAADMWAWLIRDWYERGKPTSPQGKAFGGLFNKHVEKKMAYLESTEDIMTGYLIAMLKSADPQMNVYDSKAVKKI